MQVMAKPAWNGAVGAAYVDLDRQHRGATLPIGTAVTCAHTPSVALAAARRHGGYLSKCSSVAGTVRGLRFGAGPV